MEALGETDESVEEFGATGRIRMIAAQFLMNVLERTRARRSSTWS
jgi:hypothetical protein